jgi:hypothetical protein
VALAVCSSSCAAADAICISSCRNEHQNAVAAYDNLGDCLQSSCADACQSPEAGTSCGVLVFRSAAWRKTAVQMEPRVPTTQTAWRWRSASKSVRWAIRSAFPIARRCTRSACSNI